MRETTISNSKDRRNSADSNIAIGKSEEGTALIIVLILLASLSGIAFLISTAQHHGNAALYASQTLKQAQWYATGAEALGGLVIEADRDASPERDHQQSRWAREEISFPLESGILTARMRDATGCFNLNGVVVGTRENLSRSEDGITEFDHLLQVLSFEPPLRSALSAVLVDWLDANSIPERDGAEDFEYAEHDAGFRTANGLIADISELRSMFWYSPGIFNTLAPYICVHPEPGLRPINVNMITAQNLPVLYAALRGAIPLETLEKNMQTRPATGFDSLDQFWEIFSENERAQLRDIAQNRVALQSRYIHLDVTIRFDGITMRSNTLLKTDEDGAISPVARKFSG